MESKSTVSYITVNQPVTAEPLMIAMQPDMDAPIEVQEVVVLADTIGDDDSEVDTHATARSAVFDGRTGQYVAVAAIEEVNDNTTAKNIEDLLAAMSGQSSVKTRRSGKKKGRRRRRSSGESDYGKAARKRGWSSRKSPETFESYEEIVDMDESSNESVQSIPRQYYSYSKLKRPRKREFAHRLQWKNRDMLEAMKVVQDNKMTIRGAAKRFNVPYSTLKDRIHGRVRHGTKPGVKTALSPEEEEELVQCILHMQAAGFQIHCNDIRDRARELLLINHGYNRPYKYSSPGHNWLAGFLRRHPGIEMKRTSNKQTMPSVSKQKSVLKRFFELASQAFRDHRLNNKPSQVYAMAEFRTKAYRNTNIIITVCADGEVLTPFVVFCGSRFVPTSLHQSFPDATLISTTHSRVTDECFVIWFRDHFLRKCSSDRPVVLYLSRAEQDISLQMMQLSIEEQILFLNMPASVARVLQPITDTYLENLDSVLTKHLSNRVASLQEGTGMQRHFVEVLYNVWNNEVQGSDVVENFALNGLFPLNHLAITSEMILSAIPITDVSRRESSPESTKDDVHGLTLLSELSSHEYVTLENVSRRDLRSDESDNDTRHKKEFKNEPTATLR